MGQGSRHCAKCNVRWPLGFARCPACEGPTSISIGTEPTKTKFHAHEATFHRFYGRREERRIAEGHLAPEALGKREAQQIIALERLLDSQDGR